MAGIQIDFHALEEAFENHAPDVSSYLDKKSGEVVVITPGSTRADVRQDPRRFVRIEPLASREQYRMMERFIETVEIETLRSQLADAIVGRGAFRRFKDAIGRVPEERKRWFSFRDVLLHEHILEWLKRHEVHLAEMPDWSLELPSASETKATLPPPAEPPPGPAQDARELSAYLHSWARSHGEEYRFVFGPTAFERLAADITSEFSFFRRR